MSKQVGIFKVNPDAVGKLSVGRVSATALIAPKTEESRLTANGLIVSDSMSDMPVRHGDVP